MTIISMDDKSFFILGFLFSFAIRRPKAKKVYPQDREWRIFAVTDRSAFGSVEYHRSDSLLHPGAFKGKSEVALFLKIKRLQEPVKFSQPWMVGFPCAIFFITVLILS